MTQKFGTVSTTHTGTAGEYAVASLFTDQGWTTMKPDVDTGIDYFVLTPNAAGVFDGSSFAAQVKTGKSFFDRPVRRNKQVVGWWFEERTSKFEEWLALRIPVIVILRNRETGEMFWRHVTREAIVPVGTSGENSKMVIFKNALLDAPTSLFSLLKLSKSALQFPLELGDVWRSTIKSTSEYWRLSVLVPRFLNIQARNQSRWISVQEAVGLLLRCQIGQFQLYASRSMFPNHPDNGYRVQGLRSDVELLKKLVHTLGIEIDIGGVVVTEGPELPTKTVVEPVLDGVCIEDPRRRLEFFSTAMDEFSDPIDKCWLQLHRGLARVEMGDVIGARHDAIQVRQNLKEYSVDLGALAIALAATNLAFYTGVIQFEDEERDWWKFANSISLWKEDFSKVIDEEILTKQFDEWSQTSTVRYGRDRYEALTQVALSGELLRANIAEYKRVASELGMKILPFLSNPLPGCNLLVEAGNDARLVDVIRKFAREGGLEQLIPLLERVDLEFINKRTINCQLVILQQLGQYLDQTTATKLVRRLLELFKEPGERSAYSFFDIENKILVTAATLYLSADNVARSLIRENLISSIGGEKGCMQDAASSFARAIRKIPKEHWTVDELSRLSCLEPNVHWEAQRSIAVLLAETAEEKKSALSSNLSENYGWALAAFDFSDDLPVNEARRVIADCAEHLREIVRNSKSGCHSSPGFNYQRILILLNVKYPEIADWQSLIDFYSGGPISSDYVEGAMQLLSDHRESIPSEQRALLAQCLGEFEALAQNGFLFDWGTKSSESCIAQIFVARFLLSGEEPSLVEKFALAEQSEYGRLAVTILECELRPRAAFDLCVQALLSAQSGNMRARIIGMLPRLQAISQDARYSKLIELALQQYGESAFAALATSVESVSDFADVQCEVLHQLKRSRSAYIRWNAERYLARLSAGS